MIEARRFKNPGYRLIMMVTLMTVTYWGLAQLPRYIFPIALQQEVEQRGLDNALYFYSGSNITMEEYFLLQMKKK